MAFSHIVGHELIRKRLQRAAMTGRVANSYLFLGPAGVGKKTLLDAFVAALLCEGEDKPCGRCAACVKVRTRNHPDVVYIVPQKGKKTISVDVIREVIAEEVYVRPLLGHRKLFVVEDGALLGVPAQNALLKVLEEPPQYAVFLIAAQDAGVFLPTILSRSQQLALRPLPQEQVMAYMAAHYPALSEQHPFLAAFSGGCIGRAKQMAEDGTFLQLRSEANAHMVSLAGAHPAALQGCIAYVAGLSEPERETVLACMIAWLRDSLCVMVARRKDVTNQDQLYELLLFCEKVTKRGVARALDALLALERGLSGNANVGLAVSNALLSVWEELHEESNRCPL